VKIYTRTGDSGETSLLGGSRVKKGEHRISMYGEVDELNSHLGFLLSLIRGNSEVLKIDATITKIQHELFNLGSLLACEPENRKKFKLAPLSEVLVAEMEDEIDKMNLELPALKNFILPGGAQEVAYAHICRTVTRRVERGLVYFKDVSSDSELDSAIILLNRLSDYLFTVARFLSLKLGTPEVIWRSSPSS
jgi:cob(I)alamin adenosyltransferase